MGLPRPWSGIGSVASITALLMLAVMGARTRADVAPSATFRWVTDTPAMAAAGADETVYLGGGFNYIGLVTDDAPSFVQQTGGTLATGCATRTGVQVAIRPVVVPDPSGGLFVQTPLPEDRLIDGAGEFDVSSGESFVRVGADCRFVRGFRLESFVPNDALTRGLTIVRAGSLIYVGGTRTIGPGDHYGRVAAFDGASGTRVNAWDYDRFRTVLIDGLTPGGQLVVTTTPRGGDGTRQDVGVLTPASGAFTALATIESTGLVAVAGPTLYVAAAANRALQAIDLATGQPKAGWTSPLVSANDVEVGGGRVFVAGAGLGRRGVFALSEADGTLIDSFAPQLGAPPGSALTVERIALVGNRLFLRGWNVRAAEGASRYLLAAVDATSGAADRWAPLVFAPTAASIDLIPLGERIYVGRVASPTLVERRHLAAISTATGEVLTFNPNGAAGTSAVAPVTALAPGAGALFVGTSQGQIRRVALSTGTLDPWHVATTIGGTTPGAIAALALDGATLYAGGLFTAATTSGQATPTSRGHGLAVTAAGAALLPWDPRVASTAADPAGTRRPIASLFRSMGAVVIGGDFTAVAGEPRAGLAAVDPIAGDATLAALTLESGDVVLDSAPGADQMFFVGVESGGTPIIGVADAVAGTVTKWSVPPGTAPSSALAYLDGLVYSGPEWDAETGIVISSGTGWVRPRQVPAGLLELDDAPQDGEGPSMLRFHEATEGGNVGAPRDLAVLYAGTEVYLTWRAPLRGSVQSYVIRAGPASGQSSLANFDTQTPGTAFWAHAPEGVYFVRVHARGAAGVSGPSNEISFALVPFGCNAVPRTPGTLAAVAGADRVTLSWGTAIGATSYSLEAGSRPGGSDVAVLDVGGKLGLETLAPPGRYFVRARGVNGCGRGAASNEVVIAIGGPPPQPPGNLRVQTAERRVRLEWDAPAAGAVPTFFQVEAGSAPGLSNLAVTRTAERELVAPNVAPGTYYVRARSGNASGLSDPTADIVISIR